MVWILSVEQADLELASVLPPECWNYICVLARLSVAVNKDPKQFVIYTVITKGSQGWNLETGATAEAVEDHCLLACSSQLIQNLPSIIQDHQPRAAPSTVSKPRTTSPGATPPTVSWPLSHQSSIKKTYHRPI